MSRNLLARIAVATVAIPGILWISYQGGWWFYGMVNLFAILAISEFLIVEKFSPARPAFWAGVLVVVLMIWQAAAPSLYVDESADFSRAFILPLAVIVFLLTGMAFAVDDKAPDMLFTRHSRFMWGIIYVGMLYPFVFRVGLGGRQIGGGDALLFLFGLLWIGDTAAMAVGRWIGRHKLAPTVSPNKTIEGFLGGLVGAIAVAALMGIWKLEHLGWGHLVFIALGCSVFGQLGDLVESMWKRSVGIKDSSAIIPGHGGVLDRFDSLLFAAPFMYFYMRMMRL